MTTQEATLQIQRNGQYNNLQVQTKYAWDATKKQFIVGPDRKKIVKFQGLNPGEHIVVEKTFATGREVGAYGGISCGALYNGEKVSFMLDKKYATTWNNLGGQGDKIKISCVTEMQFNARVGAEVPVEVLKFEKV